MSTSTHVPALLDAWLHEHGDELVAIRRHLHAHPELSWQEHETTAFLCHRLELAGLTPRILTCGTGLVCDLLPLDAPPSAPVVLRADIDALAMDDEKDVQYRSRRPGIAHACGHDVHTTAVLGAGLFLAHHPQLLTTPVRLLFQPAEEQLPGGAVAVLAEGVLAGARSVFGLHCDPKLDVGCIGLRAGEISSAADRLEIRLGGPGGHTARPEQTVDLVRLAATLIVEVPPEVHRRIDGAGIDGKVKVVFGSVRAGDASNVIPTHAVVRGSVRTPSMAAWERLPGFVDEAVAAVVARCSAWCAVPPEVEIDYVKGVPPVVNDPTTTALVERVAATHLGATAIGPTAQSWGGDDFAWYLRQVPGTFVRLGVRDPARPGLRLDLHVGDFDVDERSIAVGVRLLVGLALEPS